MFGLRCSLFRMKERTLGQRLREQRAELGMSQEEIAKKAGIPLDSYKKYELDRSAPGAKAIAGLARAGIHLARLLIPEQDAPVRLPRVEQPRAGYVYLPLYDLGAGAARRSVVVQDGEQPVEALAFKEDWIRQTLRAAPGDLRLIYVEGDSMEPDLRPGDIILLDHTDTTARREGIYVIRMEGGLLVKQVQRLPGGVLKLISRNEAYEPIMLPIQQLDDPERVAIIGRVVWACRRF
jgi:SOS-response transcriptional repressor LexA